MKTLSTVYPYGLNERTKFMIENRHIGKLFSPLRRYDERFIDTRTQFKITNHNFSSDIEVFLSFLKQCLLEYCSNECRKLLESFKKSDYNY